MQTQEQLSPLEQWRLLRWMMAHPKALLEDTLPWRYRHHQVRAAFSLGPRAWLCLHVLAGLLVALGLALGLALGRR